MRLVIAFKNPKADNPAVCHVGLGVTAGNAAEMLTENGVNASAVPVIDGFYLRDKLRKNEWPGVTHLVMCAPFFDSVFLEALCKEFPHITFSVVFHSNVGFLGTDRWSMGVLSEQIALEKRIPNFRTAGNCEKFIRAVQLGFNAPCTLLPNLYYLNGPIERMRAPWSTGTLRIGCFGATRILKNLPTAAWAAMIIARSMKADTEFWISTGREEGGAGVISSCRKLLAGTPNIKLVEAPWASWLEFRLIIRKMHLLMQPSFTESFNGVTADGIAEGVPSVVGPAIDWVPSQWHANPDDAVEIACVGQRLIRNKGAQKDGYNALRSHNKMALTAWKDFLNV